MNLGQGLGLTNDSVSMTRKTKTNNTQFTTEGEYSKIHVSNSIATCSKVIFVGIVEYS